MSNPADSAVDAGMESNSSEDGDEVSSYQVNAELKAPAEPNPQAALSPGGSRRFVPTPAPPCAVCAKPVYKAEQILANGDYAWHKRCFKCSVCKNTITLRNYFIPAPKTGEAPQLCCKRCSTDVNSQNKFSEAAAELA